MIRQYVHQFAGQGQVFKDGGTSIGINSCSFKNYSVGIHVSGKTTVLTTNLPTRWDSDFSGICIPRSILNFTNCKECIKATKGAVTDGFKTQVTTKIIGRYEKTKDTSIQSGKKYYKFTTPLDPLHGSWYTAVSSPDETEIKEYYEKITGDIKISKPQKNIYIKANAFGEIILKDTADSTFYTNLNSNYWPEYDILENDTASPNYFKYGKYIIVQSDDGGSITADASIREPTVKSIENDLSIVS